MKKFIIALSVVCAVPAFADVQPIRTDVKLKSMKFSEAIYRALAKTNYPTVEHRTGGKTQTITIKDVITCNKTSSLLSRGRGADGFSCTILSKKSLWNATSGRNIYMIGDEAAETLYKSLGVVVEKEDGVSIKTIELDEVAGAGGTDRNLLTCSLLSKKVKEMGLRSGCELMDAY